MKGWGRYLYVFSSSRMGFRMLALLVSTMHPFITISAAHAKAHATEVHASKRKCSRSVKRPIRISTCKLPGWGGERGPVRKTRATQEAEGSELR